MALYRTEAVVLRTRNLGEADKILTLFSDKRGKIRAVARGSRRPRNHLMGVSQPFTYGSFLIFKGKNLDSVSQGSIIDAQVYLREDLLKMAHASYIVELVDRLTEEYDPNQELFELLIAVLNEMQVDGLESKLTRFFELHFLRLIGIEPQLLRCVGCDNPMEPGEERLRFSVREGGILCPTCHESRTDALPLSKGAYRVMRWMATADLRRLRILQIPPPVDAEIEKMLQNFITFHLERPLRSVEFLHTIRGTS